MFTALVYTTAFFVLILYIVKGLIVYTDNVLRVFKTILALVLSFFLVSSLYASDVVLQGEFHRPGTISITNTTTVSQAMHNAGQITDDAFTIGAVLLRKNIVTQDHEFLELSKEKLSNALSMIREGIQDRNNESGKWVVEASIIRQLLFQVEQPYLLGRKSLVSDISDAELQPSNDFDLQAGDTLIVPSRPNQVWVLGQLNHSGAVQFNPAFKVEDYVVKAGGMTAYASESKAYMVLPNGDKQVLTHSWWNYQPFNILPGSIIYIPDERLNSYSLLQELGVDQIQAKLIQLKSNEINLPEAQVEALKRSVSSVKDQQGR